MNDINKEILEELREIITSEASKYTYNFNDDQDIKSYAVDVADMTLQYLKNGDIVLDSFPYIMKLIGKRDKEFIILFYKNLDDEYTYKIINSPILEIDTTIINPQPDMEKFISEMEEKAKSLEEVEAAIDYNKVIDRLQKILNPILDKFRYTVADHCNCYMILNDIGKSMSYALKDGEFTIEEVPYIKVIMQMMEDGVFYIVFDNNGFQIKKWDEYIPDRELPFDIKIN